MRKFFSLLIITVIIIAGLVLPINATAKSEPSVTVVSGYYLNDTLYSFIKKNTDEPLSGMEFNLQIDGYSSGKGVVFNSVVVSKTPASYMLLIDLSTSMPSYRDRVSSFAEALLQSEKTDTKISVASFGERFEVVAKDLTKTDEFMATVDGLEYNQNATDICGGVNKALKYLSNEERKEGELVNLVLITDGVPYLPDSLENHQQILEKSAKKTQQLLSKTSDVVVHSLGFSTWDSTTRDAVSTGSGLHLMAYNAYEAQSAAAEIAGFSDSLSPLYFPVNISNKTLRFNSNLQIKFTNRQAVESVKEKSIVNLNALYKKNSGKEYNSQTIIGNGETGEKLKPTEEETISATEPATENETTEATEKASKKSKKNPKKKTVDNQFPVKIIIVSAIGLIALLSIIIPIVIKSRKKSRRISNIKIEMKLEVIKGKCKNSKNVIVLYDELIVGRRSSCDIVFSDKSVAAQNTRIYIENDMVYIENIGSEVNTAIGGMKIYSPNRLRSGDEISVGNVMFKLLF